MKRSFLRAVALAVLGLGLGASVVAPALAQSAQCDAWRGELARIERSGGYGPDPRAGREAQRVAAEIGRLQGAAASLQCDGSWIFQAPPAECGAIRARLGQLRSTFAMLQQQSGGSENRRRALMAAINDNCRAGVYSTQPQPVQPQGPRNLFEALFGVQPTAPQQAPPVDPMFDQPLDDMPREARWGSGRPVCVRTCDGFFFPLSNSPGGREGAEEMCQALCPATETQVFYMPGDGNIEGAVGRRGVAYSSLPNAGRYLRQFDASCSCRKPGQSWAQALADAEDMIDRRRGDILVTAQRAEEMSRPRQTDSRQSDARQNDARQTDPRQRRAEEQLRQRTDAALQQAAREDAADQRALDQQARQAPTAGTESSGIASGGVSGRTVGAGQGERREVVTPGGERRTVRVVAPGLSPVLQ